MERTKPTKSPRTPTSKTVPKLIHVGKIVGEEGIPRYLYLRKEGERAFCWYDDREKTDLTAPSIEEAIRLAYRNWKLHSFTPLHCGFLYSLPDRDEHGINAYFYQMAASYSAPTGIYFSKEHGHPCLVQFASQEALDLWDLLNKQDLLGKTANDE